MTDELGEIGRRARKPIAWRLLPFVFLMYVICYVDRANVSFANLRMSVELGFSDRVYGLGVGMFFIGYVLFEVPGAIVVERWSARKWLARIMVTWGIATIFTAFVRARAVLYGAVFRRSGRSKFLPGHYRFSHALVPTAGPGESNCIVLRGGSGRVSGWFRPCKLVADGTVARAQRMAMDILVGRHSTDCCWSTNNLVPARPARTREMAVAHRARLDRG